MKFIMTYSGWAEIEPENMKFRNCDNGNIIDGLEYSKMSESERESYVIDSMTDALLNCSDGSIEELDVEIED